MTERGRWPWFSDTVFAGGGKKKDKPSLEGHVVLEADGRLRFEPEDDYYCGEIDAETAKEIAREILGLPEPVLRCMKPIPGWVCVRPRDHEGSCKIMLEGDSPEPLLPTGFEKPDPTRVEQPSIFPCHGCGALDGRKGLIGDRWLCKKCIPPIPCEACGLEAGFSGLQRFCLANSDTDEYQMDQGLIYKCVCGHHTHVVGKGPGVNY